MALLNRQYSCRDPYWPVLIFQIAITLNGQLVGRDALGAARGCLALIGIAGMGGDLMMAFT